MSVRANKTCKTCGHSWYPKVRNENVCPCCGGSDLVMYVEAGQGGGSSFVAKKNSGPAIVLAVGLVVIGAGVFFWYTENFNKNANPFRDAIDGKSTYTGLDAGPVSPERRTPAPDPVNPGPTVTPPAPGSGGSGGVGSGSAGSGSGSAVALPPLGDDRLHLVDGRVLQGKVMAASDDAVGFRWRDESGKVQSRSFPRAQIQRLQRAGE